MYLLDNIFDKNYKIYFIEFNVYYCLGLLCFFVIIYVIIGIYFYNSLVKVFLFFNIFCLIYVFFLKVNEVYEFD